MPRIVAAIPSLCLVLLLPGVVPGMAHDPKHYPDMRADVLHWFRSQKSPKTGGLCCTEHDGVYAEEDIRDGIYWTRFYPTNGDWIPVPPEVVIHDPNRNGAPVAWFYYDNGVLKIRCYAPGAGL